MNGSASLLEAFIPALQGGIPASFYKAGGKVAICPPFPYLSRLAGLAKGTPIGVGGQNVHPAASGAFTGEISTAMLTEQGATQCIIGHSERRQLMGETDGFIKEKLLALLAGGITPIVCVGETLSQREAQQAEQVVGGQIEAALEGLTAAQGEKLVVAYEPVWAIGTGRTATPEQANEMHGFIRGLLAKSFGGGPARKTDILYGGSVNAGNAASLLSQPELDGALVGGASLKSEEFLAIIAGSPA